ncbi:RNA polymerase sigma factor [Bacillus shivajii]|uniref:RNA polymerase sigma factor n=1 Tax=Bacillus shivajii TaxID=1983719 RepID=UPI001CFC1F45|nr:RNA polymerase sigma factor [Bacillus shivajii]UCZ51605.1 RNA polymerase sigma factor [Bacillus shivajii]
MEKGITLEEIYSVYMMDLYRYIYSLCKDQPLTEDIVQETFYRAYFHVETFEQEKVKPWLFKVAYHTFIDIVRKEKRISYYGDLEDVKKNLEVNSAEHEFMVKNRIDGWFEAVGQLPISKRKIIILRDYYHFSYHEIAEMFDISISKVKVTIFRGRKDIQKLLEDENRE